MDNATPSQITKDEHISSEPTSHTSKIKESKFLQPKKVFLLLVAVLLVVTVGALFVPATPKSNIPITTYQATIKMTSTGFQPADTVIRPWTKVTWVNDTTSVQSVGAIPFPTHSSLPQLNSTTMQPNATYSYIFTTTGNWQFTDDQNPLLNGMITSKN